jgi:hypothetical protein
MHDASPSGLVVGLAPATLEFWVRFPNERNQGKQAHPVLKYRVPQGSQWAGGWACTSHPGVLGSIPKREEPGKTGAPCIKVPGSSRVPAPPWVGSRSPDGWDQIPRWAGGWACTSHPGVLGSIPKREEPGKTGAPCVKVPGSSRVPAPPWVGSRSPDGWDQIPRWAGGWACTSHPGVLGSIPKREEPGKTGAPCIKVPGSSRVPAPPWVGSRSPDGWDQIPRWAGGWACTSHPGVLGSFPKREEPGKTGAPCVKVPGSSRVPQIPRWAGGWACTSHPGVLGSIPKREEPGKTGAPCIKVPGSSRVPVRAGQTHPHRPRLVVSHSTCPPLSSSPHAHSFVIGPAVIKHTQAAVSDLSNQDSAEMTSP